MKRLRDRIASLESEVAEMRQLNKRIAELADVVSEVLLPAEQRDDQRLRDALAAYDRSLRGSSDISHS
jgi:hypothetical protein